MKILLLGSTHGNELLGPNLFAYIMQNRHELLEYVDLTIANPRALANKVRFIDCDLNRSYGKDGHKYEQNRAMYLSKVITKSKYDLVIDLHTTNCQQPNINIVHSIEDNEVKRFLKASHINTVLQVKPMNDIGTVTSKMVAYEIPNQNLCETLYKSICDDIQKYIRAIVSKDTIHFYKMTGKIYKKDITLKQLENFKNFQKCEHGFIPIMIGENSYKEHTNYYGFKANKRMVIKI